jgi:prophage endopeptidase
MKILAGICAVLVIGLLLALWRLDHISTRLDTETKRADLLQEQAAAYDQALAVRDSIDTQYQEVIRNAEESKPQLVADLDTGVKRVYVRAACVPANPQSAGGPDAAAPELAADARQDYADLVAAHRKVTAQVLGLQQFILGACNRTATQ